MKPLTREWVTKAEGDWATATRELRSRRNPNYDGSCFHAQQCIEKYLKARLQELNIEIEHTHNLVYLLNLLLPAHPIWESMRTALVQLNNYAVTYRYPGESADREVARRAVRLTRELRAELRRSLGLEPIPSTLTSRQASGKAIRQNKHPPPGSNPGSSSAGRRWR